MGKCKKIAMRAMATVMCASVSAGVAFMSVSADGTEVKGITSALAGQVVASDGATAAYGTKTLNNVVTGKGYATEYSGLVLTGGEGATFDLGTLDLTDFNWTDETNYDSFIEMVFAPTADYTYDASGQGEIQVLTLTLTDAENSNNKIVMQINGANSSSDTTANPRSNFTTYAEFEDENGATQTQTAGTYRLHSTNGDQFIANGVLVTCGKKGNAWKPFKLVYDYDDNALYTPDVASNFPGSYELRKYGQTYTAADGYAQVAGAGSQGDDNAVAFDGFTSGKVNVSIGFDLKSGATSSSLVLTSLAGVDLTQDEVKTLRLATGKNVTDTLASSVVTSDGATAAYGTKSVTKVTRTTSKDENNNTVVNWAYDDENATKFSGLVLTGGVGATFDLGTVDLTNAKYTSDSEYDSFISFAVTPEGHKEDSDFVRLWITLTDVENPTNSIKIKMHRGSAGNLLKYADVTAMITTSAGSSAQAGFAASSSTKNVTPGEEEGVLYSADTLDTSKKVAFLGATDVFSLTYDKGLNALYGTTDYNTTCGYSALIRDFDTAYSVLTKKDGTVVTETVQTCSFSGKFNVTIQFDPSSSNWKNGDESSIVVTEFGGVDLTQNAVKESYLTNAKVQVNGAEAANGATVSVGDTVNLVSTDANKSDLKSMKVNGAENTTDSFKVTLDMFNNSILKVEGEYGTKYAITVDGETETLWDIESYTLPTLENGIGYGLEGGGIYKSGATVRELSKEMEFTSLTLDVKANTQLSLASSNANSGLRFVTQINQADLTKIDAYTDITFYGYLTLKDAFNTKCADKAFIPENINYDESTIETGMNDEVNSTDGYKLKVLKITQQDTERWMSEDVDEGYLGFCVTLVELYADHYDDDYLFLPAMEISYADGTTEKIVLANATDFAGSVKTLSENLIVSDSLYGESGQIYQYEVTVGGETKYSVYDEARLKVLYAWAGNTTIIGTEVE